MKIIKNNKAFTLLEVLVSMVFLTIAVTTVSEMQIKSLFRLMQDTEQLERIFFIKQENYKKFWQENIAEQSKKVSLDLEKPATKIKTEMLDIEPKSELKEFKNKIKILKTEGTWDGILRKSSAKMVSLVFIPPKTEEEQKQEKKL
jgi:competence protein ComGF